MRETPPGMMREWGPVKNWEGCCSPCESVPMVEQLPEKSYVCPVWINRRLLLHPGHLNSYSKGT